MIWCDECNLNLSNINKSGYDLGIKDDLLSIRIFNILIPLKLMTKLLPSIMSLSTWDKLVSWFCGKYWKFGARFKSNSE